MPKIDNSKKIGLKNKIIILVVLLIGFFAILSYFIIMPTISDILNMKDAINQQRHDLEKKYLQGQSLRRLSENLKKTEPQLTTLNNVFIDQNRALEFVTTLEGIAAKNNVSQKINLMTDNAVEYSVYKKIPLQVMVEGDFPSILNYLIDMESLNYYININNLDIVKSNDTGKNDVVMQITADTYWK